MPRPSRKDSPHLLAVACFLLSLWPTSAGAADLEELEEVIDESRLTFARFVGHPDMVWFRERARKARAVFIAPQVTRASYLLGASWGTGVLLVRNPSTGRWSQPAFYQVTGLGFGLQIGALHSEVVALATDDRAADEMVDGAFTLGIRGAFGAGRYGRGLSGSLETTSGADYVTLESQTGLFVGIAAGATLILVRDGANELYYGRPVELDELKESRIRQWYSDRLVKTLTDLAVSPEASP